MGIHVHNHGYQKGMYLMYYNKLWNHNIKPFPSTTFSLHNISISTFHEILFSYAVEVLYPYAIKVLYLHVYLSPCDIYTHTLLNTYFMQMSAPAPLLLMSVVCVVLSQSRSTCPENQVLHSNGRCCQYVRCHPRKYITLLLSEFIMIINRLIDWFGNLIKIHNFLMYW